MSAAQPHGRPGLAERFLAASGLPASTFAVHAAVALGALAVVATAALAALGAPLIAPLAATRGLAPQAAWLLTAGFAAMFFVLQKQGFVFHWRNESMKVSLDEIALFLGAIALPPAHIVLGVAASSALNQALHRRDPAKAVFNVGQYAVAAAAAMAVVVALRWTGLPAPWPAAAAPPVFAVSTCLLVSVLFSRMGEAAPGGSGGTIAIFRERFGGWALVGGMLGVSLGLVVYALHALSPLAVLAAVPVFYYLRRFGRLSEWADDELKTHKLLAAVGAEIAGRSDLDTVARSVLTACHEMLACGEAQLALGAGGDPRSQRFWRATFGEGAGPTGGVTAAVLDPHGGRLGELTAFPKHGQRAYGEREHHLLRTIAANAASAAANARALQAAMDANRQLVASEQRYRSLFETANVFIHVLDAKGRVVDMNPAAFAALGHAADEVLQRPVRDILSAAEGEDDLLERLERDGELRGVEARFATRGGGEVCVLLDAQVWEGGAEEGTRYILSSRDVTHLKALERELRAAMASQRETIRRLENMNRELEEFTLWTTHDMREPLRSIGTIAQFLHEDVGSIPVEEARDMARRVHEGAERLKERVKALHAFSRIVQRDDAFEDVDLRRLVGDVLTSLEAKVRERGAVVRVRDDSLPVVRAQPQRFHQVLANLVENALKYGARDGEAPVVEVGCEPAPHEWRFYVRDSGPGIPATYHERIFHLFQRGPETSEPGSGAGLAIVKRIVEQHGGRVWLESRPGGGACFRFTIPRGAPADAPVPAAGLSIRLLGR